LAAVLVEHNTNNNAGGNGNNNAEKDAVAADTGE